MAVEWSLNMEHISLFAGGMRQAVEDIIDCSPDEMRKDSLALYAARRLNDALNYMQTIGCLVNEECTPSAFWEDPKFYPIPVAPAAEMGQVVMPLESGFLTQQDAKWLKEYLPVLEHPLSQDRVRGFGQEIGAAAGLSHWDEDEGYDVVCSALAASTEKLMHLMTCFWLPVWDETGRHVRVSLGVDGDVNVDEMVVSYE